MHKPHIVILGAGPAGLGAAFALTRRDQAWVTVLERNQVVGGNAGSFKLADVWADYGSHRLHPACYPIVLRDIQEMLGDDLLDRPRHGRIRLRGHWIHFPLKPLDLALKLPPTFGCGVAADLLQKVGHRTNGAAAETFSSILERGLGQTICREFYFPFARKLWGIDPEELSPMQAKRRVSANSLGKMARKVLAAVPGLKPPGSGRFYYPRQGYGQISEAYHQAAQRAGAKFHFNAMLKSVEVAQSNALTICFELNGEPHSLSANYVWSTIPITALARCIKPSPPSECLDAVENIDYRAMILIYLVLEQDRFSEYDAHYFPEAHIPISRLSEPKNYSASLEPRNRTVLCAEVPCSPEDSVWKMPDEELGNLLCDALASAGIPVQAPVLHIATRRLRQAYPIYRRGYESSFSLLDQWLSRFDGVLTFGRQGLFAHDNTHHALFMAYSAANCLTEQGDFDRQKWQDYRRVFETHVVED